MMDISCSVDMYFSNEEAASEAACYLVAKKQGLTKEQADTCEAGERNCPTCPWGDK